MNRSVAIGRVAAVLVGLASVVSAQAQDLDNFGTDFINAFMPNFDNGVSLEIQLASASSTMVTIEYPVNAPTFTTTVAVDPGTVTVVSFPTSASEGWAADTLANNAFRASASSEFAMYVVNRRQASSDVALALPIDTMNTEYLVTTYNPLFQAEFVVVAGFNNTTVTITPSNPMTGRPAGVPFSITLNRGEGYLGQSLGQGGGATRDLTGTVISADRPVGLSNGNRCTNVPNSATACDHLFEIAQPLQTWGMSIPVTNLPLRINGSIYKILASEDGTVVTQDGATIGTLNAGQFIETAALPGNHVFEGDKPIYVVQYMTGQSFAGNFTGDPAMGNMIPSAQYQSGYTFSTPPGNQFAQNFVSIIADDVDVGNDTVLLDGAPVPAGDFSAIPGTNLSAAVVAISGGTHTTSSSSAAHGITVEGYNSFDSYIYPGGALFQFINPPETDPPICTVSVDPGPPPSASGTVTDDRPEDSGVFFVRLLLGSSNVVLTVDAFDPPSDQVAFNLNLIDPGMSGQGTVRGTDGAGNTCQVEINLSVDTVLRCDVDGNGQIDRSDIGGIMKRRNQPAQGPDDPADANGDGFVDANDARMCVLLCTSSRCAL